MKLADIAMKQNMLSASDHVFDKLHSEVIETLKRQISEVPFLIQEYITEDDKNFEYALVSIYITLVASLKLRS